MQRFILIVGLMCLLVIGCGVNEREDNIKIGFVEFCIASEDREKYFCVKTCEGVIIKKLEKLDTYLNEKENNEGSHTIIIKYVFTDNTYIVNKYKTINLSDDDIYEILKVFQEHEPAEHPFNLEKKEKKL